MNRFLSLVLAAGVSLSVSQACNAQWSTDADNNLSVADDAADETLPRIARTSDGGVYVAYLGNPGGGYNVYLQRLDAQGNEQWVHGGILIYDAGHSSTQTYEVTTDADDNAVIVYRADNNNPSGLSQVGVQKVSPCGELLWGPTGKVVTSLTVSAAAPQICRTSDGNFAVGWSFQPSGQPSRCGIQKIDGITGDNIWGAPVEILEASRYIGFADIQAGANGSVYVLWVRGSSANPITSSKALYCQRFDSSGVAQLNSGNPVIVFNTTSVQNGYFPSMLPDGNGGVVFGWYEIGGSRLAYIQHLLNDGTFKFASPIANTGPTSGRIRISAGLGYNSSTGEYYLASDDSASPTQGNYAVIVQKFDSTGARLWGDNGVTVLPTGTGNQPSFTQVAVSGDSCIVAGFDSRSAVTRIVYAARVNAATQTLDWSFEPSANVQDKGYLVSTATGDGGIILAFQDGSFGTGNIDVQRVNQDSSLAGPAAGCAGDFDHDNDVDVADLFGFLDAWFANFSTPACAALLPGNFDKDADVDVADLFGFLDAWFAQFNNCP